MERREKWLKNMKFIFCVLISIIFIFPNSTNAENITNNNGVVMTEEEYNDFLKVYSNEYIMLMSEEKYNELKNLDFDNITKSTKYVESVYNPNLHLTTEREVTKAEYDNFNPVMPLLDDGGASAESTMKIISLAVIGGTTWNNAIFTAAWKGIPSTRSFDVIGFYGFGLDFGEGTQQGNQIYELNGTYSAIDYAWNGTNIKKFDNGFGISMNIVNSDITDLQLLVECYVTPTVTHPTIYASYQHAVQTLSLADSQNYTLGGSGLGSVFIFPYSISQKYDGMSGVSVSY